MWPKINGSVEFPVRFVVIGPGASPEVRNLTNRSNVIVRGGVEDLSPYYSEVAVVPIRASGGTRIKLLEAAIYAVPIVTTSCGAAGMAFSRRNRGAYSKSRGGVCKIMPAAIDQPTICFANGGSGPSKSQRGFTIRKRMADAYVLCFLV